MSLQNRCSNVTARKPAAEATIEDDHYAAEMPKSTINDLGQDSTPDPTWPSCEVTHDPEVLVGGRGAQAGDLFLFDTLLLPSELIKLADNRPVSHCGISDGGRRFFECTAPTAEKDAIRTASLDDLLAQPQVRTITLFEYVGINAASRRQVVKHAQRYVDQRNDYANVDLVKLALPSLLRSYGAKVPVRYLHLVRRLLEWLAAESLERYEGGHAGSERSDAGNSTVIKLTCSSYVYRCYVDAGLPIDIVDPLALFSDPAASIEFHDALTSNDPDDLVELRQHARSMIHALQSPWAEHTPKPAEPFDAAVTPKDFWSSPSFQPRLVLHRPPRGAPDKDIDRPGPAV